MNFDVSGVLLAQNYLPDGGFMTNLLWLPDSSSMIVSAFMGCTYTFEVSKGFVFDSLHDRFLRSHIATSTLGKEYSSPDEEIMGSFPGVRQIGEDEVHWVLEQLNS